jgi:hypothetical protein
VLERFPSVAASASDGTTSARARAVKARCASVGRAPPTNAGAMSKHTSQAQSAPYTNVCLRSATNKSATSARAQAQPQQMGEAPVKYELTGAS